MFYYRPDPQFLQAVKNREIPKDEMQAYKDQLSSKNKKYKKMSFWLFGIMFVLLLVLLGIVYIGGNDFANEIEGVMLTLGLSIIILLFLGILPITKFTSNREILRAIKNAYPKLRDE